MELPSNIAYGTVVGQFIAAVADGADTDTAPDAVAMTGSVTFIASSGYVIDTTAQPNPVVIVKTGITCYLDTSGYLCSPYPDDRSVRGVQLVATDDPDLNPVGWKWNVVYNLTDPTGKAVAMPNQIIDVPTNSVTDLAIAMPLSAANATMITKGDKGEAGDMVTVYGPSNVTGPVTLTDSAVPSTRLWTLTGNVTLTLPTPVWTPAKSGTISLILTQDATGGRTITWPASVKWPDGIAQQPAGGPNTVSAIHLMWTGTTWLGMVGGKSFA